MAGSDTTGSLGSFNKAADKKNKTKAGSVLVQLQSHDGLNAHFPLSTGNKGVVTCSCCLLEPQF